jgi:hypothetical protein
VSNKSEGLKIKKGYDAIEEFEKIESWKSSNNVSSRLKT